MRLLEYCRRGMFNYSTARQTQLLSDKLLAGMDKRDRVKMRKKGRGWQAGEKLTGSLLGLWAASWREDGWERKDALMKRGWGG